MEATAVLTKLKSLGVSVTIAGDKLRMEVLEKAVSGYHREE
ncbi:MAG: hypothetical protein ABIH46_06515 [Chloroflexota bacterium]